MSIIDAVWYGRGAGPVIARGALSPLSLLYGLGARVHGWQMRRRQHLTPIPVLSIGNVSVGGTGKTPVAAWAASQLLRRGARPAIVMRGYGNDEPLVHAKLNANVPVVADPDRVRAVKRAFDQGADCAVLDDGFQSRRVPRVSDWVLVAAEQFTSNMRVLPAGPLREPLSGLGRANVIIVTRKSATLANAEEVSRELERYVAPERIVRCVFTLGPLGQLNSGAQKPIESLRGQRVLAVAGVGAPEAFFAQLRAVGADVHEAAFPDHHAFTASDIARLVRASSNVEAVVCTLKDAVKLGPQWPAAAMTFWYVSQHLVIEHGQEVLDHWIEKVLAARQPDSSTAGSAGTSNSLHGHRSSTAD